MASERHGLVGVIGSDFIRNAKLPLFLLAIIVVSATCVVTVVYQTRLLIAQKNDREKQINALDVEWRNLLLEEKVLGERSRVENNAIKHLHMQYVDSKKENIVMIQ
ncbi:cell division protein FtsL [Xenorhabdus vietnamensis]|uniref:Cell division protein FtsL n=2 Tax=Xenorhabdus vietnamensis TaxID=351656 RepID=A0A1Y2SFH9_9GAMM|nr:cell division protein FtsL [Xenorhabdus vietnamensis]